MFVGARPSPGPGEEAWTETDVEYALAWKAIEAGTCGGCGQPVAESFDADNADVYGTKVLRCFGCEARDQRMDDIPSDQRGGLRVVVVKDSD